MNINTSGALLVAILAAAGFVWGSPLAVWCCIATCAAAFLAEEARMASFFNPAAHHIAVGLGLISWFSTALAALALLL